MSFTLHLERENNVLAPNFFAHSSLLGLVSIANTLLHPFALAPWRIESPTHPIPNTATVEFSADQPSSFPRYDFKTPIQ
jgi:hypothetical protein